MHGNTSDGYVHVVAWIHDCYLGFAVRRCNVLAALTLVCIICTWVLIYAVI
jgi:hypothetical protein